MLPTDKSLQHIPPLFCTRYFAPNTTTWYKRYKEKKKERKKQPTGFSRISLLLYALEHTGFNKSAVGKGKRKHLPKGLLETFRKENLYSAVCVVHFMTCSSTDNWSSKEEDNSISL